MVGEKEFKLLFFVNFSLQKATKNGLNNVGEKEFDLFLFELITESHHAG